MYRRGPLVRGNINTKASPTFPVAIFFWGRFFRIPADSCRDGSGNNQSHWALAGAFRRRKIILFSMQNLDYGKNVHGTNGPIEFRDVQKN